MNTTVNEKIIEKVLKKIDGRRWTKTTDSGKTYDRLYIDKSWIIKAYGYKLWFYNTGNISYAELDGEKVSNYSAKKTIGCIADKIYIDLTTLKLDSVKGATTGLEYVDGIIEDIITEASKDEEKVETTETTETTEKPEIITLSNKAFEMIDDITHVSFGDSFGDITAYVDEMKTWCDKDVDIDVYALEQDMLQSFSEYMREIGYEKISEMRETDIEALCEEYQETDDLVDIIDDIFGDMSEIVQQWDIRQYTKENFNPEKYINK